MSNEKIDTFSTSQKNKKKNSSIINEHELNKEEKEYAKIFDPSENKGKSLEDLTFFECDYILRCIDGLFYGKQIRLKNFRKNIIRIGSDENITDLYLEDNLVSPLHCELNYVMDSFYYTIEDSKSKNGTWMKVLPIEDGYLIEEDTEFILFQYKFVINILEQNNKKSIQKNNEVHCRLKIIECPNYKKETVFNIKKDATFSIGKKECNLNLDINININVIYKIYSSDGKIYIADETKENYLGGLFFRIKDKKMIRAGDCINIGGSTFSLIPLNYSVFNEIGDRPDQEDKYVIQDDLRISDEVILPYFAVYDGHGGATCSEFIKKYLHDDFHTYFKYKNLNKSTNFLNDLILAIQEMIIFVDINYYDSEPNFSVHHGSTCIIVFFIGTYALCCNLGDSLSILVKKNGKRIYLSRDFNPSREKEKQRIEYKKGFITKDDRLLGKIAVSRGFGDWKFKDKNKQYHLKLEQKFDEYLISNRAEFRIIELNPSEDNYILLASDGIFQKDSQKEVIQKIDKYINNEPFNDGIKDIPKAVDDFRLDLIKSNIIDKNLRGKSDNMTLILIHLFNEELYD